MKKYPFDYEEYKFFYDNKKNIDSIEMLVKILNCIQKGFFHNTNLFSIKELNTIVANKDNSFYTEFCIKKKNGRNRKISAPNPRLKQIQSCIRILLTGPDFKGQSTTYCAMEHVEQEVVYNIDIKDFYDSINASQITLSLVKKGYNYIVANYLSLLVTKRSENGIPVLPQGGPSSPAISNIVVSRLDARLNGYAKKHNIKYSRYVDDITFSCKKKSWEKHADIFKKIILTEGFTINKNKCRVSFQSQRQKVLGIVVNSRLNVTKQYIKQLRTIIHNWEKDGYIKANNKFIKSYLKNVVDSQKSIPLMEDIVAGKLSYLKMVRKIRYKKDNGDGFYLPKQVDPVWQKLYERYTSLRKRDYSIITGNASQRPLRRIFRYGDDIGPLVYAERYNNNENWNILKILDEDNRKWYNGNESEASRIRYGEEPI